MTISYVVKCDNCDKTHEMDTMVDPSMLVHNLPHTWVVVCLLEIPAKYWLYFCSQDCLRSSFKSPNQPAQEPQEQPACKARRFLLVDGETADIYEGVKFGNGHVGVQGLPFTDAPFWYESWEKLKEANPGSGVQWIDQEVNE